MTPKNIWWTVFFAIMAVIFAFLFIGSNWEKIFDKQQEENWIVVAERNESISYQQRCNDVIKPNCRELGGFAGGNVCTIGVECISQIPAIEALESRCEGKAYCAYEFTEFERENCTQTYWEIIKIAEIKKQVKKKQAKPKVIKSK